MNKLALNEHKWKIISKEVSANLQIINAASLYQLSYFFHSPSLQKTTLRYIERCFNIVSDTESFVHLDYKSFLKILVSSELSITSEIEVFKAAEKWLNHNTKERGEYAKCLLSKVRLHLLSKETVRQLLNSSTYFKKDDGCIKFLNEFLDCSNKSYVSNTSSIHDSRRYCSQNSFEIVVCGGIDPELSMVCDTVRSINLNNLGDVDAYPQMITKQFNSNLVYVKGNIYAFGGRGHNNKSINSVDKFSLASKTWSQVSQMHDDREGFCTCAFLDKIYIFGGLTEGRTNSCLQLDTSDYSWKEIARMKEARDCAACAVFEERVVVAGGLDDNVDELDTVESFDAIPDKWSSMPSMNFAKSRHSLVVAVNKLFVISDEDNMIEVYDSVGKTFVTLISPKLDSEHIENRTCFIGNKVFIFQDELPVLIYDTVKKEWTEESCKVTRNLRDFSCVKVPCL